MKTVYFLLLVSIVTSCSNNDAPKDVQDNEKKKEFNFNKIESVTPEEQGAASTRNTYSWESDKRGDNSYDYEQYNDVDDAGLIFYNYSDVNFTEESPSAAYRFRISDANASSFSSPATNSLQPTNPAAPE